MSIEQRFAYDSFRPGQRELAERVHDALSSGETLLAEAMSGFGKTSAVLAGALTAAEESGSKVVYACRTKRQINRVMQEVERLQRRHQFNASSLLSKFDYCLLRRQRSVSQEAFGWYCSFNVSNNLCSYFLNVTLDADEFTKVVEKFLARAPTHSELLRESETAHLCPYEVARLSIAQADVAVIPYHYVFDPASSPVLFDRNSMERKKTLLVVDEAHNIRDFFRGLRSATITLDQVDCAIAEAKAMLMEDAEASLRMLKGLLEKAMASRPGWLLDRASVLDDFHAEVGMVWLQNLSFELTACADAAWGSVVFERRMPSMILRVGAFLAKLTTAGSSVLVKWENALGLVDPDPTRGLSEYLSEFRGSVLLSATMNPSEVFSRSIGLGPGAARTYEVAEVPSVVVKTVVDTGTSTRYRLRTPEMFARISDKIGAVVSGSTTGVGVFVPSYAILDALSALLSKRVPDRPMLSEARGLSNQQASDLFDAFNSEQGSILLAVQGGRFSEGEDFAGDSMGAVVVVGLSLPPPTPMMYAEYAHLKRSGEQDSYLMLSRLPALRKAFQAAGRHVRGPGKRGLVFLLDQRFDSDAVRGLMPSWLRKDLDVGDFPPGVLASVTRGFWGRHG